MYRNFFNGSIKVLLYVVIIFSLALPLIQSEPLRVMLLKDRYRPLIAISGSMEPAISSGDLVIVDCAGEQKIVEGEIITFKAPRDYEPFKDMKNGFITHRIVSIKQANDKMEIRTRGDANDGPDNWIIDPRNVIGRAKYVVPYAGSIIRFIRSPKGSFFLMFLPSLLIITSEIIKISRFVRESKKDTQEKLIV